MTELGTLLLDGDLPLRTRVTARIHLLMCVHCRRFQRQLAMLAEALSLRADAQAVPGDFVKCGEGKCGASDDAKDGTEGKCGEGKCGGAA